MFDLDKFQHCTQITISWMNNTDSLKLHDTRNPIYIFTFLADFVELKLQSPSLSWSLSCRNIFQNIYNLHMLQVLFCYLHSNRLILHKISYLLLLYNSVLYFKLAKGFKNRKSTVTVRTPKIILTCTQTLWDAKNSKFGCLILSCFN